MKQDGDRLPHYSALARHWALDEQITFLNHGSFGATPSVVLEKQAGLRKKMEAEPVRFMVREAEQLWDEERTRIAEFIGTQAAHLVFVRNTTMGVNTVFRSLEMERGAEVLVTNHTYGACLNTIKYYAKQKGYNIKVAHVPFPLGKEEEVLAALDKEITSRTRLLFIDHVTSATGTVFPVEKIIPHFKNKGVDVFVDGAHAPGMVDLHIDKMGADYYVGNCHKWICSPKGSAILYVHPAKQANVIPLQISHLYDRSQDWAKQFFWPGTDDYTAYFCVGAAIGFMGSLFPDGWNELRMHNRNLALRGRKLIADTLGTALPVPDSMTGSLANIYLGKAGHPPYGFNYIHPVQEELFSKYKIEVPVIVFPSGNPMLWVRPAFQVYNDISQYEYLAGALAELREKYFPGN